MLKSTRRIKVCRLNKSGGEYLVIYGTQLRVKWGRGGCKNVNVYPLNHGNCFSFSPGRFTVAFHRELELPVVVFKTVNEIRTRPDGSPTRSLKLTARREQKPRPPLPCRLSRCVYFSHTVIYNVTVCVRGGKIIS